MHSRPQADTAAVHTLQRAFAEEAPDKTALTTLSYRHMLQQGWKPPWGICANSTKALSSSTLLLRGMVVADVCAAASWVSPCPFLRFYLRNMSESSLTYSVLNMTSDTRSALSMLRTHSHLIGSCFFLILVMPHIVVTTLSVIQLLGMMSAGHMVIHLGLLHMRRLQRWFIRLRISEDE